MTYLASRVTKWSPNCDKLLYRLICYIDSTKSIQLKGHVGDATQQCRLELDSDADFAGCKVTKRSTIGIYLCLGGPNTFVPLNAISKKQTAVSYSLLEAELIAAQMALRLVGLPAIIL